MTVAKEPTWASRPTPELLEIRIRDLGLRIAGSGLERPISKIQAELQARGLVFRPRFFLGDEWFSPEGVPAVAIPFVFAHPRLVSLEREMLASVEGEDPAYFMKLLRHEVGHAFDHAYRLSRTRTWRALFGPPEQEYDPDRSRPRPYSRSYVRNLENHYAQSHPDEDFAETFAVWLDPSSDWKREYARWPLALAKLEYVDQVAGTLGARKPPVRGGAVMSSASRLKRTLGAHYARRKKDLAQDCPDFFDRDLKRIFDGDSSLPARTHGAAAFLRKRRAKVAGSVSYWTRERKYTLTKLIDRLVRRSEELGLRVGRGEAEVLLELAAYLSSLTAHSMHTGRLDRWPKGRSTS